MNKTTHKYQRKHNFSIIELLVVMIIMSILLAVALPSFTHLGKSHKLTQAAQDISGQIAIARSYAIANHCSMAVVFPQKNELEGKFKIDDDSTLPNFYNASCRIALVTKNDDGYYEFVMWKPDSNWLILPESTFIPDGTENFGTMGDKLKNVRIGDLAKLSERSPSEETLKTTVDIERYIIINSDGQLIIDDNDKNTTSAEFSDGANKVIRIRVTEGGYDRATKDFIFYERSKGKQFYQYVEIDPLTGRTNDAEKEE